MIDLDDLPLFNLSINTNYYTTAYAGIEHLVNSPMCTEIKCSCPVKIAKILWDNENLFSYNGDRFVLTNDWWHSFRSYANLTFQKIL